MSFRFQKRIEISGQISTFRKLEYLLLFFGYFVYFRVNTSIYIISNVFGISILI